jgi:hypothetical protein
MLSLKATINGKITSVEIKEKALWLLRTEAVKNKELIQYIVEKCIRVKKRYISLKFAEQAITTFKNNKTKIISKQIKNK